ncbi:MAG: chitobiase/beta-hexosaminidase C-terminal domain-containing protein [Patescibacteria group bacterium]|nr:chitobiase/beta-hexosaminidase C-terminal domain-containing protein [Patescibacteria group bacterium]
MKSIKTRAMVFLSIVFFSLCLASTSFAGWSAQTSGITSPIDRVSFATSEIGAFTGFDPGSGSKYVYKTTNGGDSWASSTGTSGGWLSTYFNILDSKVYSAMFGNIDHMSYYYNNDLENSDTWNTDSTGKYGMKYAIKMVDSTTSYQVGYDTVPFIVKTVYGVGGTELTNTDSVADYLYAIDCLDTNVCFAVGANGAIVKTSADSEFSSQGLGGTFSIRDVSMISASEGYAVGDYGFYYKYNGSNWSTGIITALPINFSGISCPETEKCWAVGAGGVIYKTTNGGSSWNSETSGISSDLNAVDFYDANTGWAVGDSGVVLSYVGDSQAPTTTASPSGGTYDSAQSVTLTPDETATTYYTIDGSTPTEASTVYSAPITISQTTTLKFFSKDTAGNSETPKIESYIIVTDSEAPVTTASPASGTYFQAQTVTLTATDTDSGVAATYYTTDGTDPTTSSTQYSSPITISETTTLKFFSVDNAGNIEAVKTEIYNITTPTPIPTPFTKKVNLESATLDTTYHSTLSNTDLVFYRLPKRGAITDLYVKLTRNKKGYNSNFIKKLSYPGHVTLTSNIGLVDKDYYKNVDKHIKFKVAIRYSQNKINKLNLKEGKLRLYYKTETGIWKGPYTVYQNKDNNVIKFKIRNYLLTDDTADIASANRTYSPTFYFKDLTKIKFILAEKGALGLQLETRRFF